ncbi:MAG: S-methyl-5-thioribose-1-phosphate isomerase [Planctomycetota bacterium]|nr:MAG: S-methyl-5-thioribose-1-phosphate isomerase [Planctomycetota bacterium]
MSADRTIWIDTDDPTTVVCIDQRMLPFEYVEMPVRTSSEMTTVIADMVIRGAGCIGVSAGYGMYLAALATEGMNADEADASLEAAGAELEASRPTAVNLSWAVQRQLATIKGIDDPTERIATARELAETIANEDIAMCAAIGQHGLDIIRKIYERTGRTVKIMTHCNAGWLAFVKHGTATAPMYAAHAAGIPIHVYVSETRPRNQGARLTAWELNEAGVPLTLIADNSAGHLLQHGEVDLVIVGSDRTTIAGDVANKIGTYMKAVVAHANGVPFYAALPSSTIDPTLRDGVAGIPIEERGGHEVTKATAWWDGRQIEPQTAAPGVEAANYGFDVTPATYVTGIITERGVAEASEESLLGLYPEFAGQAD